MAETCRVLDPTSTRQNITHSREAISVFNDLKNAEYLSDADVKLATALINGCNTRISLSSVTELKRKVTLLNNTPLSEGKFANLEEKRAAFSKEFKRSISDPDGVPTTKDSVEESLAQKNFNTGIVNILRAVGDATDVACGNGKKEALPPPTLTPAQAVASTRYAGPNAQNKEGVLANLVRQAEGKTEDEQLAIWKKAAEQAEKNFGKLKNPSQEAKDEHEEAAPILKQAGELAGAGNKSFALQYYKQSLSAQPASVFPLDAGAVPIGGTTTPQNPEANRPKPEAQKPAPESPQPRILQGVQLPQTQSTNEGVLEAKNKEADGKSPEDRVKIWSALFDSAEKHYSSSKNVTPEDNKKHDDALQLKQLAESTSKAGNMELAAEFYKSAAESQPFLVGPNKK